MKTVGLITEYNPFHNGHLYHIEKAKELTGADRVIVHERRLCATWNSRRSFQAFKGTYGPFKRCICCA